MEPAVPHTRRKLREARFFFDRLRDRASDLRLDADEVGFYLSAFLSAARSVTLVLQVEEKEFYDAWYDSWLANLSPADQGVFKFMNAQRVLEVHLTGADVTSTMEFRPVTQVERGTGGQPGYKVYWSGPPGTPPPEIGLPVHQFRVGDDLVDVGGACRRYLSILEQLVRDFTQTVSAP